MRGRVDVLFPECCYGCPHYEQPQGTCDHDLDQLLRARFSRDPDRPCPVAQPDVEQLRDAPRE